MFEFIQNTINYAKAKLASEMEKAKAESNGNAIAIMTFGAIFSLVILAVGIYAISQIIKVANLTETDPLYSAIQQIPGGVITIVGVVILAITISLIAVALAIFAQSMPGSMTGR
jgi:hypothetical protein